MKRSQQFNAPVGHVAGADLHVHQYWPDSAPPDDPAMSVTCWQCRKLTWRYTRHCIHCALDLRPGVLHRLGALMRGLWRGGER